MFQQQKNKKYFNQMPPSVCFSPLPEDIKSLIVVTMCNLIGHNEQLMGCHKIIAQDVDALLWLFSSRLARFVVFMKCTRRGKLPRQDDYATPITPQQLFSHQSGLFSFTLFNQPAYCYLTKTMGLS